MLRDLLCVKGIAEESLNRLLLLLTLKKQPPEVFCEEKFSSKFLQVSQVNTFVGVCF